MSLFKSMLPVLAGLGVGILAPELLPALGTGGAGGAAGAAGAAGTGAAAGGAEAAGAGLAAGAGTVGAGGTATGLAAATPGITDAAATGAETMLGTAAPSTVTAGLGTGGATALTGSAPMVEPGFLDKAGTWLGNHPEAGLMAAGALMGGNKTPAPTMSLNTPQIMSAGGGAQAPRMGGGPPDLGFQQALMANLGQRRRMG